MSPLNDRAWARFFACALSIALPALAAREACAQAYPSKVIRLATAEVGAGGDFAARQIAQGLTGALGQQVIVENRGGFISIESVAKAPPDGYTLLLFGSSFWIVPLLRNDVAWDPVRDFAPITLVASAPNILAVHPSIPANSAKELIALAKSRPGALNYGSGAAGSVTQLAAELFKAMAGVNIVQINYRGTGPAINALIAGEVHLLFVNAGSVIGHVKSGRVKGLAVTSAQPSALAPGLPTVAASGLPGYESTAKWMIAAPADTPGSIIARLNKETVRLLAGAEMRERFFRAGVETAGSSPDELAAVLKAEMARLGKLIRNAGIRAD